MYRYITFMTDFGTRDDSVGCCHGVMLGRAPDALIIDITHGIAAFDVRRGALTWANVLPYMPVGVHVGVVDPGVGTARRPLAVRAARGDILIGPDNGLAPIGAEALGGVVEAVELANEAHMLTPRSNTFHGRDIFSPMAAALATGTPLADLGPALDPVTLVALPLPRPRWQDAALRCHVAYVDHFGNLRLDVDEELVTRWGLQDGDHLRVAIDPDRQGAQALDVPFTRSFGLVPPGAPALIVDSYRRLMLAINQGNAADTYGAGIDTGVMLRRA